jgi:hypothetical protein
MASMKRVHHHGSRLLAVLVVIVGLALVATTLARGGGPLALGVVLGAMFVALGAGRLALAGGFRPHR